MLSVAGSKLPEIEAPAPKVVDPSKYVLPSTSRLPDIRRSFAVDRE